MQGEKTSKRESSHDWNEIIELDSDSDNGEEEYSLSREDLRDDDGALSALLDEFRDMQDASSTCTSSSSSGSSSSNRYPEMIPLLQHFEVYVSTSKVRKMAAATSKYFTKHRYNSRSDVFVETTRRLYSDIRDIVGKEAFDRVSRMLRDGMMTMALGLAPSLKFRSSNCPSCFARRVLHQFCPQCGVIFDIKKQLCDEMGISKQCTPKITKKKKKKGEKISELSAEEKSVNALKKMKRRRNNSGMAGTRSFIPIIS